METGSVYLTVIIAFVSVFFSSVLGDDGDDGLGVVDPPPEVRPAGHHRDGLGTGGVEWTGRSIVESTVTS